MRRRLFFRRGFPCLLACILTLALAAGCGPKKTEEAEKKVQKEQTDQTDPVGEVVSEAETVENVVDGSTTEPTPPPVGEMAETETDALGNPLNDDGIYYDENGNLVSEEENVVVDEDGNPITDQDMIYSEGGSDGWESVEYGDKEDFAEAVKSGYEEVTELSFEPANTYYMLYANGVYEIQYEGDTDFLTFTKGQTEEQVNRITVAYDREETVKINDADVRIQSFQNVVYLALWSKGDYCYSVYCDQGCTRDEMVRMVSSVQ